MITVVNANALQIPLPDQSVQCVITSPPYWGLRDYGTATWEGGSAECNHVAEKTVKKEMHQTHASGRGSSDTEIHVSEIPQGNCIKCGARRIDAQIGLEPTPAAYVANIVRVMREVWRVLRDDGTLWLNLGDSYAANRGTGDSPLMGDKQKSNVGSHLGKLIVPDGLKPKDLCGIPWRVAFALQDDGWYLRSDVIWAKPNPMPESVTDRPTKAHEYVFLLTKQARYYYDAEAIKENFADDRNGNPGGYKWNYSTGSGRNDFGLNKNGGTWNADGLSSGRNRRSVWTVATSPYSGAHFATFPPALVEPMILAGTSQRGACPTCGAGWVRVVESKQYNKPGRIPENHANADRHVNINGLKRPDNWYGGTDTNTLGWQPSCSCYAVPPLPDEPDDKSNGHYAAYLAERARILELYAALPTVPCRVLDPFCGTATVGRVCAKQGRDFIGTELNLKYITLADERTSKIQITMPL